MPIRKLQRNTFLRTLVKPLVISFFLVLFVLTAFLARPIYDFLTAPPTYKPEKNFSYTEPIDETSKEQDIIAREASTKALLPGAKWIAQTFNNCGPATTSMVLQYFGYTVNQNETKAALRTNSDDKNVFTYEMADYLRSQYNIESKLLYNGNIALLKKLVANGFYVVVEDWLHPNEDIGHVTIIRGFDDEKGVLIADDSYIGINITYPYEEFDQTQWKAFNREYLPVYRLGNEKLLKDIIGSAWDTKTMYQQAIGVAQSEISKNPNDMYAWFNLGTSAYGIGDYQLAKEAFEQSRSLGWPKRMLWYQIQPIQTYNALGEYQKALELTQLALWSNDSFAEAHVEAAIAYKGLGNTSKAREEIQIALNYAPDLAKAKNFLDSL
jgi:tetratricopeptide (TPR) repeat protein